MDIAKIAGIPIRLHWSFLALLAAFGLYAGVTNGIPGLIATAIVSVGLFTSVVLHELGHAIAARRYGIGTAHITLYPFGGVAAIEDMPEEPTEELVIALAGPAVNFALVAVFGLVWSITGGYVLVAMITMNLAMGLFNLIPAFPMDGGRVLRALLARRMGYVPASMLSIRIGRAFAWIFLLVGVVLPHPGLLLVGAFLHLALSSEKKRLVEMIWERQRQGSTNWRDPRPWGGRQPYASVAPGRGPLASWTVSPR